MASNSLAEVIGIRRPGLEAATILPLGLTMILFLGPIAMLVTNDRFRWLIHPSYWTQCFKDWIWWRNHVVAPFTEEFAFRYVGCRGNAGLDGRIQILFSRHEYSSPQGRLSYNNKPLVCT